MTGYCFDHVSIGVRDAEATLARLRKAIGLVPLSGERLPRFRYVLSRVGDAREGMQLELIEPQGDHSSFMFRFLENRGEGVHHLTFTVPDVERTIREATDAGFHLVQIDLEYPPWREAFIFPSEPGLGVVVQIADSTLAYPPMHDFVSDEVRDPESIPHNHGGVDRDWWQSVRGQAGSETPAILRRVELESNLPQRMVDLFVGILGGQLVLESADFVDVAWGDAVLRMKHGDDSGVRTLVYEEGPAVGISVGGASFVREQGTVEK